MAVVIDGHTLGVVMGPVIQILRASVLRGSPYPSSGVVSVEMGCTRPATKEDFESFGVVWHQDYN